jgi:hypothetical protein
MPLDRPRHYNIRRVANEARRLLEEKRSPSGCALTASVPTAPA